MGKLHELLAVEDSLKRTAKRLMDESMNTFRNKENLFTGNHRHLEMLQENDKLQNTDDHNELDTTVDENLLYVIPHMTKYIDIGLQKDLTNQQAVADIVVDGKTLATKVPATTLLGLETKLAGVRELFNSIPTLEPSIRWVEDASERPGVFRAANDVTTFKTKKDVEFRVAYEATVEHAAQIVQIENTVNTGIYTTTRQSGKVTPHTKARRLERIDTLLQAVKQARMRANSQEIIKGRLGGEIFKFING